MTSMSYSYTPKVQIPGHGPQPGGADRADAASWCVPGGANPHSLTLRICRRSTVADRLSLFFLSSSLTSCSRDRFQQTAPVYDLIASCQIQLIHCQVSISQMRLSWEWKLLSMSKRPHQKEKNTSTQFNSSTTSRRSMSGSALHFVSVWKNNSYASASLSNKDVVTTAISYLPGSAVVWGFDWYRLPFIRHDLFHGLKDWKPGQLKLKEPRALYRKDVSFLFEDCQAEGFQPMYVCI